MKSLKRVVLYYETCKIEDIQNEGYSESISHVVKKDRRKRAKEIRKTIKIINKAKDSLNE